jgi:hypothetical protein
MDHCPKTETYSLPMCISHKTPSCLCIDVPLRQTLVQTLVEGDVSSLSLCLPSSYQRHRPDCKECVHYFICHSCTCGLVAGNQVTEDLGQLCFDLT